MKYEIFRKEIEMKSSVEFLYLSQEDVIACGGLDMAKAIQDIEKTYAMAEQGQCLEPLLPSVAKYYNPWRGRHMAAHMGCLGGDLDVVGALVVISNSENPIRRKAPTRTGIFLISDLETGFPLAIMDVNLIGSIRTGAIGGVAARYLAHADSEVVAVIGAGVINRCHIMALNEVLKGIKQVKVFDIKPEKAQVFAREIEEELGLPFEVTDSAQEAIVGSDVIAAATPVSLLDGGYVEGSWVKEGSFFSQLSAYDAKVAVIQNSDKFVLDTLTQLDCRDRGIGLFCAQGLLREEDILDLGDIVNGKVPGRENDREKIFFKSWGVTGQTLMTAYRVYTEAKTKGVGQVLELWHEPHWV